MTIRSIMTTNVITVRETAPLSEVARIIVAHHLSGVPVVDDTGRMVGIISERDVLREMHPLFYHLMDSPTPNLAHSARDEGFEDISQVKTGSVMTREVQTIAPDTSLMEAAALMFLWHIRRLPVVEDGQLVGIVSQGDVYQAIFSMQFPLADKDE